MARSAILSNGQLLVGLNEQGLVHDFYYPYVGLDNLTNARSVPHKIGVWVDGRFHWIDDGSWQISVDLDPAAMMSAITMHHEAMQVTLLFKDFVLHDRNAFCRRIEVTNNADFHQEVRVFMHQAFQISRAGRADTALYVPDVPYILDYKGRCCLLIYGESGGAAFDQFAVGNYNIEGKEGTFRDAEDGQLSGNAVEHGGVDSVIRFSVPLDAKASETIDYWVVAAASQQDAEKVHDFIKKYKMIDLLDSERAYWRGWLSKAQSALKHLPEERRRMAQRSLLTIKAHVDKRGGIIASADSSIYNYGRDYYNYVWPRDAAYALWPLIRLGFQGEARSFFEFCRDILHEDGYLMHKYQPDRAIGSTWHPLVHNNRKELAIQEDETAIVLFLLGEYARYSKDEDFVRDLYETLIRPAANFMAGFFDEQTNLPHASYDLWEQKFLTTTYTVFLVQHALYEAAGLAESYEYPDDAVNWRSAAKRIDEGKKLLFDADLQAYRKGLVIEDDGSIRNDNTIDVSSLYGSFMFTNDRDLALAVTQTAAAVEEHLLNQSPAGGVIRYEHDGYFLAAQQYKGNPWLICTLWLAQFYLHTSRQKLAESLITWVEQKASTSGMFSEQVDAEHGSPVGVAPLVWSHAEYLNTVVDFISNMKVDQSTPGSSPKDDGHQ